MEAPLAFSLMTVFSEEDPTKQSREVSTSMKFKYYNIFNEIFRGF